MEDAMEAIRKLIAKGVRIPVPAGAEIGAEVDVERTRGDGAPASVSTNLRRGREGGARRLQAVGLFQYPRDANHPLNGIGTPCPGRNCSKPAAWRRRGFIFFYAGIRNCNSRSKRICGQTGRPLEHASRIPRNS